MDADNALAKTRSTIKPMRPESIATEPLQVVTVCRARDLPILEMAAQALPRLIPFRDLRVVVPDADYRQIQRALGGGAQVISERSFVPRMSIDELRGFTGPGFPKMAGWYYQQFIKLQFAFLEQENDHYLIWDADTVPLRPMRFFDEQGRMLLTRAEESHQPYFETYRRLFGSEANREFSFIAQHMLVRKSFAREMLAAVEQNVQGAENWAWKIMRSLSGSGNNLFSEYETYGHYVKNRHPDSVKFVERPWYRVRARRQGNSAPSKDDLDNLAGKYDYAAFERVYTGWRRWMRRAIGLWDKS